MRPKQPHSARLWRHHLEPSWGFPGVLVGQAGSFILIPLRVYVLRVRTRFAIGSNLGIILFAALTGLEGNLARLRVHYFWLWRWSAARSSRLRLARESAKGRDQSYCGFCLLEW
jgi:uncharacterized membrane protein YfcA